MLVAGWIAFASLACYLLYAIDKRAARSGRRGTHNRIPERTLLLLGLAGGWPGALLAQRRLRHKCAKLSFQVKFWLSAVVSIGTSIAVLALLVRL